MIPSDLNCKQLILMLNALGWKDHKIALVTNIPKEHISQIKSGKIKRSLEVTFIKLYNFHQEVASTSPCPVAMEAT